VENYVLQHLDYPDFEVQGSFNKGLTEHLTGRGRMLAVAGEGLIGDLGKTGFTAFRIQVYALLAEIPYPRHESWYASLFIHGFPNY